MSGRRRWNDEEALELIQATMVTSRVMCATESARVIARHSGWAISGSGEIYDDVSGTDIVASCIEVLAEAMLAAGWIDCRGSGHFPMWAAVPPDAWDRAQEMRKQVVDSAIHAARD